MCIHYCTVPAYFILIDCVRWTKIKISSNALAHRYRIRFLIRPTGPTNFQTRRANFGSASDIRNRFIYFFFCGKHSAVDDFKHSGNSSSVSEKKRDNESKRKMKKTWQFLFVCFPIFFSSWPTTTFYLNSMRLKLEILFRQLPDLRPKKIIFEGCWKIPVF